MSSGFLERSLALLLLAAPGAVGSPAAAEPARVIRVAADPNNLPFSNERLEGFENRLAELIAAELDARLEYLWWPQRRGFFRETIGAGRADLVMGVPAGFERVLTTRPYYHSTYMFVFRRGTEPIRSYDDPRLRTLTVGVQLAGDDFINTPPAHALSRRGIIRNVRGFTLYGNYADESPPAAIIHAVARGEVDLAVAWGPMAGYFAGREQVPLELAAGPDADGPLPLVYAISVGVRRGEEPLRRDVDAVLVRRREAIDRILEDYRVPRVSAKPTPEASP